MPACYQADIDDTEVGAAKKDDLAMVAAQGFKALMEDRDSLVADIALPTKMQCNVSKVVPDTVAAEQHRKLAEPGADNQ